MNREKILAVAEAIETGSVPDLGFNMSGYLWQPKIGQAKFMDRSGRGCGTIGCIAGWTIVTEVGFQDAWAGWHDFATEAQKILDLDDDQASRLFFMSGMEAEALNTTSSRRACLVLRRLAETGKVDWRV